MNVHTKGSERRKLLIDWVDVFFSGELSVYTVNHNTSRCPC